MHIHEIQNPIQLRHTRLVLPLHLTYTTKILTSQAYMCSDLTLHGIITTKPKHPWYENTLFLMNAIITYESSGVQLTTDLKPAC